MVRIGIGQKDEEEFDEDGIDLDVVFARVGRPDEITVDLQFSLQLFHRTDLFLIEVGKDEVGASTARELIVVRPIGAQADGMFESVLKFLEKNPADQMEEFREHLRVLVLLVVLNEQVQLSVSTNERACQVREKKMIFGGLDVTVIDDEHERVVQEEAVGFELARIAEGLFDEQLRSVQGVELRDGREDQFDVWLGYGLGSREEVFDIGALTAVVENVVQAEPSVGARAGYVRIEAVEEIIQDADHVVDGSRFRADRRALLFDCLNDRFESSEDHSQCVDGSLRWDVGDVLLVRNHDDVLKVIAQAKNGKDIQTIDVRIDQAGQP